MEEVMNVSGAHRKESFNVYLLYEKTILDLNQKTLTEYAQLVPTSDNVEGWSYIRNLLRK